MMDDSKTTKTSKSLNRILLAVILILSMICIGLLVGLIFVSWKKGNKDIGDGQCTVNNIFAEQNSIGQPRVFSDLTRAEIAGLKKYLYEESGLDLVKPSERKKNASYVFVAELHLPNKSDVIAHLDEGAAQPPREAKVIVIRGKQPNTEINELVVGPLPNPTYHKPLPGINASLPYFYRPMTDEDYGSVAQSVNEQVHEKVGNLIETCFDAKLVDCAEKCIELLYFSPFSPVSSGVKERKLWYWLTYVVEYYSLHPVDFSVLANIKEDGVLIEIAWFQGRQYSSLQTLADAFNSKAVSCVPQQFPNVNKFLFSTLHQRGATPDIGKQKRNPEFVQPDGIRYSVQGNRVNYMHWSFDFRLSTSYGPQLYDIRYKNERIVYELGLQEISVFYSGHSPQQRFSDYMDSAELIGPSATGLVPGVDCPNHATFYDTMHITETSEEPDVTKNVFCLFELNTGEPLRRHHSYWEWEGKFFGGMENVALVLRTILTIVNYDYVIDFRFFQNGFVEVKGLSTGYILGNAFAEMEKKYGFQLHDRIVANFHTHLFNFKVDLDIYGHRNRYDTINIETETELNEFSQKISSTYSQATIRRQVQQTEKDAAYKFNFDSPKYHIFYNNDRLNQFGNPKSYRLINKGMIKQVLPEGEDKEPAINWARYQMAVTKQKDTEAHSSSMYSMYDTEDQVVNFQKYIDDNENIIDEDLVIWVTMGLHHIPRTEDLPLTTTPGAGLSFYLQPFNYFPEDPAMYSPNAVRIDERNSKVHIERYGMSKERTNICVPIQTNFDDKIKTEPVIVFQN